MAPRAFAARVAPWLGALAWTAAAAPSLAAPPRNYARATHVLQLGAGSDDDVEAIRLTKALEKVVLNAPEIEFINTNKALLQGLSQARCGQALLKQAMGREPLRDYDDRAVDAACLEKLSVYAGSPMPPADRFVWGMLYHDATGALWAKLHAWERGQPDRVAAVRYKPELAERIAERLLAKLFLPTSMGEVRLVASRPLEGELFIGGKSRGPLDPREPELALPVGDAVVEVRLGGRVVARGSGYVIAGQVRVVDLEPITGAGPSTGPREGPQPPRPELPLEPQRGAWKRTAGFVGLGLGAAMIGVGVVSSLRVKSLRDDFDSDPALVNYRSGLPVPSSACDAAGAGTISSEPGAATAGRVDRLCSVSSTFGVAQYVFYGAGALAVGAGAYLLATAPPQRDRALRAGWTVLPWAGPGAGGVRFGASFLRGR